MIEGLVTTAGRLETVLSGGATLAAIVILLKFFNRHEFKVWNVEIKLGYVWLIFSAFICGKIAYNLYTRPDVR